MHEFDLIHLKICLSHCPVKEVIQQNGDRKQKNKMGKSLTGLLTGFSQLIYSFGVATYALHSESSFRKYRKIEQMAGHGHVS